MTPREELIEEMKAKLELHIVIGESEAEINCSDALDAILDAVLAECTEPVVFKGVGHFGGTAPDCRPRTPAEIIAAIEALKEGR
jgi:hypothetical protein